MKDVKLATTGAFCAAVSILLMLGACQGTIHDPPPAPAEDPGLPPPRLDLPTPPKIVKPSIPSAYPDGTLSVRGLRTDPGKHQNQQVQVRGVVVELYVCPWAAEVEKERKARERALSQGRKPPESKPTHPPCKEPYFFVADGPAEPHKLLVAGYEESETPPPAPGDRVLLTGTYVNELPQGFMSTEGLLDLETWTVQGEGTAAPPNPTP